MSWNQMAGGGTPEGAAPNGVKQVLGLEALQIHSPSCEFLQQLRHQPLIAGPIPLPLLQGRLTPAILLHQNTWQLSAAGKIKKK